MLLAFCLELLLCLCNVCEGQVYVGEMVDVPDGYLEGGAGIAREFVSAFVYERYDLYFLRCMVVTVNIEFVSGKVAGRKTHLCGDTGYQPLGVLSFYFVQVKVHAGVVEGEGILSQAGNGAISGWEYFIKGFCVLLYSV